MAGTIAADMRDRLVEPGDGADGEDGAQIFGRPVGLGRGDHRHDRARLLVAAQLAIAQRGGNAGEQRGGGVAVDQQGLGRAAHRGAAHLGVDGDRDRHVGVGRGVDVGVAQPFEVAERRHFRFPGDALDQRRAAARDDQLDRAVQPFEHHSDRLPIRGGDELDDVRREPRLGEPGLKRGVDRDAAGERLRSGAEDDHIGRAQADRRSIGGDVGAALVDHADHPDRGADAGDVEPVGRGPACHLLADHVGQGGDRVERGGHCLDPLLVEAEAVDQPRGGGDVVGIGGEDGAGIGAEVTGHGGNARAALLARHRAERVGGGSRLGADGGHLVGQGHSITRSSRWMSSSRPEKPRRRSISALPRPAMAAASVAL